MNKIESAVSTEGAGFTALFSMASIIVIMIYLIIFLLILFVIRGLIIAYHETAKK